ncbi:heavy metal-associated domain-containing protein [Thiotrichales bacterium HSG1]|nr:heavy metal-associated domain-containing protein [Thiotrichales bacterium HSG1]
MPENTIKTELAITGMMCANCVNTVERTLRKKTPGIVTANVNYATETATIEYLPNQTNTNNICNAIKKAGYGSSNNIKYFIGLNALTREL